MANTHSGVDVRFYQQGTPSAFSSVTFAGLGLGWYVVQGTNLRLQYAFVPGTLPTDITPADSTLTVLEVDAPAGAVRMSGSGLGDTEVLSSAAGKTPLANLAAVGGFYNAGITVSKSLRDVTEFGDTGRRFKTSYLDFSVEAGRFWIDENFGVGLGTGQYGIDSTDNYIVSIIIDETSRMRYVGEVISEGYDTMVELENETRSGIRLRGVGEIRYRGSSN